MTRPRGTAITLLLGVILSGCGQVITRIEPTASPTPQRVASAEARPTASATATRTPAPYTPAPTSTPTLTPTPVVYRVQRGDNLMKIAKQFGVTAIAMQEANGITDPRSLRVGQELIVPVEEGDVAVQTPTVLPTAVPFGVGGLAFGTTQRGETWGLGEIINTAPFPIEQVRLLISLLDEEGKPIAQAEAAAELPLIVPGGRSPFAVRFQKPAEGFANYTTTPLSAVEGFTGSYYLDLEASDITGMGDRYATYTVSGTLRNTGPEDAVDVVVAVTAYDALGRVIGERVATPEHNVIPRGGATTFRVLLTPIGGPAAAFAAVPLGRRIPMPTPDPG